jgi:glycerate kinase
LEIKANNTKTTDMKFFGRGMEMKIIIASDSYKGSLSTLEVANSIEKGIRKIYEDAEIIKIPVADGGEGTLDTLVLGTGGIYEEVKVLGPLGNNILAKYGILDGNIAVVEVAEASGLTLMAEEELNPLITTSYGTGELVKAAIDKGMRKIYVGLGGSGTNDGGVGMAQALGVSFKDHLGNELGFGGGELNKIHIIDSSNVHPSLKDTEIILISDVQNSLCGPNGASYIFGPQKGATIEMVKLLDENLKHFGLKVKEFTGKDIIILPGSGAAGGLGAGLMAFTNAKIHSGIDTVLDIVNIDQHLEDANLVITGEGRIDRQSIFGKAPVGVAKRAKQYNLPVIAIVGSVGEGGIEVYDHGIDMIVDIIDQPMTLEEALNQAPELIEKAATNIARIYKAGEDLLKLRRD